MDFLIDTVNLTDIREMVDFLPIKGVTSNPSILKKESPEDFYAHMKKIREIIGKDRELHIQLTATDFDEMMDEAKALVKNIDSEIFIKVPTDFVGIKVIKALKEEGYKVTATAIYDYLQAVVAMEAGSDYIAPYYNRIADVGGNPSALIKDLNRFKYDSNCDTNILAASFHALSQISDAIQAGTQAVTVAPNDLRKIFTNPNVLKAVEAFRADWFSMYKDSITDLKS